MAQPLQKEFATRTLNLIEIYEKFGLGRKAKAIQEKARCEGESALGFFYFQT